MTKAAPLPMIMETILINSLDYFDGQRNALFNFAYQMQPRMTVVFRCYRIITFMLKISVQERSNQFR